MRIIDQEAAITCKQNESKYDVYSQTFLADTITAYIRLNVGINEKAYIFQPIDLLGPV